MSGVPGRRGWGRLRKLSSGRYHASYVGPDLVRYNGPTTYTVRSDAQAWLASQRLAIEQGRWERWTRRRCPHRLTTCTPSKSFGAERKSELPAARVSGFKRTCVRLGRFLSTPDPTVDQAETAWGIDVLVSTQFTAGEALLVDTLLVGRVAVRGTLTLRIGYAGAEAHRYGEATAKRCHSPGTPLSM
jgi:hypothetical protein